MTSPSWSSSGGILVFGLVLDQRNNQKARPVGGWRVRVQLDFGGRVEANKCSNHFLEPWSKNRWAEGQGSLPRTRLLQATWAQSLRSALSVSACEWNESVFEILT